VREGGAKIVKMDTALWLDAALLPSGWARRVRLQIAGGMIQVVQVGADPEPGDERHALGLPGLCNLHSHAFQRAMAGLTEARGPTGDSFWSWRALMYRFVDRLTPDDVEAIAALAYLEMLEAGFTRVGEFHYLHHDPEGRAYADPAEMAGRIAAAADQTGIGLTLLPVFYAHANFGGAPPSEGQRRFIHDVDGYARLIAASRRAVAGLPDAVVGVAPHSLRAVSGDELSAITPLAGDGPVHIHIAEQTREVDDCLAATGQRPVAWLLDNQPVDRRWCLVHATHMTPSEVQGAARSGAVAGLCPITEANLGDGVFAGRPYLAAGGRFGVGSDSNVLIDAAQELRLLEYSQRLTARARNVLAPDEGGSTGAALFTGALRGGAQALGIGTLEIGALGVEASGLRVGASADLMSLDTDHPAFAGKRGDALLDAWIFAGRAGVIDCVWRRGRKCVERGRHHARGAIIGRYVRRMVGLLG
jgi:formiminoglutamate deiminase